MEKQTKILLGLAAAGVVAYLVFKPKGQPKYATGLLIDPERYNSLPTLCSDGSIQKQEDCPNITKFSSPNIEGVPVRVENFGGPDKSCPDGFKYVEYPIIKGFREHLSDSMGGKCVENSVDIAVEDSSIHLQPRLFI